MMEIAPNIVAGLCLTFSTALASAEETRPNILFILSDDHTTEALGAYGDSPFPTPQLDRLAESGAMFTAATVPTSVCGPSRASLLTGRFGHVNGFMRNEETPFDGSQSTFPKRLQAGGYETALVGKWHLDSEPTGFDYYNVVSPYGVGQGWFYNCRMVEKGMNYEDGGYYAPGYLTDDITDISLRWLETIRDEDKPFCLLVHHKAPHTPYDPAPRHEDLYADTEFEVPDNLHDLWEGRALEGIPVESFAGPLVKSNRRTPARLEGETDAEFRERHYQWTMRGYGRLMASLDENIGRLLDYLDETGLAENTIVIYASDNGYFLGQHGLGGKFWIYEESLMVPLLIRWPGVVDPGTVEESFVSLLDMAPTLVDISGQPVSSFTQGKSLEPLLRGEVESVREVAYYRYYDHYGIPAHAGVRDARYKLAFYPETPVIRWELFDLETDPAEMNNRFEDPELAEVRERLLDKLVELAEGYEDPILEALLTQRAEL